jgi:hypothetical protein
MGVVTALLGIGFFGLNTVAVYKDHYEGGLLGELDAVGPGSVCRLPHRAGGVGKRHTCAYLPQWQLRWLVCCGRPVGARRVRLFPGLRLLGVAGTPATGAAEPARIRIPASRTSAPLQSLWGQARARSCISSLDAESARSAALRASRFPPQSRWRLVRSLVPGVGLSHCSQPHRTIGRRAPGTIPGLSNHRGIEGPQIRSALTNECALPQRETLVALASP